MLILSNQIHSFTVPADSLATVTIFSEDYVPSFASHVKSLESEEPIFRIDDDIALLFDKMTENEGSSVFIRKASFYAICDQFLSKVKLKERSDTGKDPIVRILDWVETHCTEDISLKDVASVFGYEYHYLSRLLNKNYNISFSELLNGHRIDRAIELLQSTSLSITDIAVKSGFQSIRNFNLVFKTVTGKSPKDFRG